MYSLNHDNSDTSAPLSNRQADNNDNDDNDNYDNNDNNDNNDNYNNISLTFPSAPINLSTSSIVLYTPKLILTVPGIL